MYKLIRRKKTFVVKHTDVEIREVQTREYVLVHEDKSEEILPLHMCLELLYRNQGELYLDILNVPAEEAENLGWNPDSRDFGKQHSCGWLQFITDCIGGVTPALGSLDEAFETILANASKIYVYTDTDDYTLIQFEDTEPERS
jgi:hypothetical protein